MAHVRHTMRKFSLSSRSVGGSGWVCRNFLSFGLSGYYGFQISAKKILLTHLICNYPGYHSRSGKLSIYNDNYILTRKPVK